jgi:hypothetical protein
VIDRIRVLLGRPLSERERRRLFALAVAVILLAAGAFALLGRSSSPAQRATRTPARTPAPRPTPPSSLPATDAALLQAPSEEGQPRKDLQGSHADVAAAKRGARRFLSGYLPYSYGQRGASAIPAASVRLRRRLAATGPRVPGRQRRRHPNLVLVQSNGVGPVRADLVALVRDGSTHYTVPLEVTRERHGWIVTAVGG